MSCTMTTQNCFKFLNGMNLYTGKLNESQWGLYEIDLYTNLFVFILISTTYPNRVAI